MIAKQKILIVDDDENIAELISLYLMKECFDTKIVSNGEDALSAFETYQPNLVLLDLMLPGIDGYQVCRELRAKCLCYTFKQCLIHCYSQILCYFCIDIKSRFRNRLIVHLRCFFLSF